MQTYFHFGKTRVQVINAFFVSHAEGVYYPILTIHKRFRSAFKDPIIETVPPRGRVTSTISGAPETRNVVGQMIEFWTEGTSQ